MPEDKVKEPEKKNYTLKAEGFTLGFKKREPKPKS